MSANSLRNFIYDPNGQYLFKRAYALSLGPPNQTTALQYGTIGIDPAPLRVTFEIEKTAFGSSPNHSKISVYNLASQTRNSLVKGYLVNLQAGYNNLVGTIFTGNIYNVKSKRNGPDIITEMECLDGGSAIVYARLDKSYGEGITLVQILKDVADAMSVVTNYNPVGVNAGIAVGIPQVVYNKGFVAQGPCQDTLNKLLKPQGLEWSIQDGNLNIIPKAKYDGATAIIISAETGMIDVPSQNQFYTQYKSLLNPRIVPGSLNQLISENEVLNGYYKVRKAKYDGDSHGDKWQVECESTKFNDIVQTLPTANGFNYTGAVVA